MSGRVLAIAGVAILLFAWAGPLPHLVPGSFAAHMALHMSVVGIGVPLLAIGLSPRFAAAANRGLVLPIAVSILDLVVVWLWHAPYLHHASRSETLMLALEQASFAGIGFLVWLVAFAGAPLAGAMTLFFTSMHMTLLGALVGLANRPIYAGHGHGGLFGLDEIADQQLGGIIMLAVGGVIYLGGGLVLAARALRPGVKA